MNDYNPNDLSRTSRRQHQKVEPHFSRKKDQGSDQNNKKIYVLLVALFLVVISFVPVYGMIKNNHRSDATPASVKSSSSSSKASSSTSSKAETSKSTSEETSTSSAQSDDTMASSSTVSESTDTTTSSSTVESESSAQSDTTAQTSSSATSSEASQSTATVGSGQGAYRVATNAGISVSELQRLNPGVDVTNLAPGQSLRVK